MPRLILLFLAVLFLTALPRTSRADAPSPSPAATAKDPNEARQAAVAALAKQLIDTPDDEARRRLLVAAQPPDLAHDVALRRAFETAIAPIMYAGELDRSDVLQRFVRAWAEEEHDPFGIVLARWGLANAMGMRGDNHAALPELEECQRQFEAFHDRTRLAGATVGAGIIRLQLGEYRRALEDFHRANVIYEELDNKEGIINTLNSMGSVYNDQCLPELAQERWQRAMDLATGDASWEVILLGNLGGVQVYRGEYEQGLAMLRRALALAKKIGEKPRVAYTHDAIGEVLYRTGQLDAAEREFQLAIDLGREMGDQRRECSAAAALARIGWRRGREHWPAALALAERALALAHRTGEPIHLWEAGTLVGKLHRALGHSEEARRALEEAIAVIEDARGRLSVGDEGAALFLEDKLEPFQELVALHVEAGDARAALNVAEQAKARVLVEVLRGAHFDPQAGLSDAERAKLKALNDEVSGLNRQIAEANAAAPAPPPEHLAELNTQLGHARRIRDTTALETIVAHPELGSSRAVVDTALLTGSLDRLLGTDGKTVLLEYAVAEKETFLFTVRKLASGKKAEPEIRVFRLPRDQDSLKECTRGFRRLLAERDLGWQTHAREFGASLLAPAQAVWAGAEKLVIVPDGVLWELPFQVLIVGNAGRAGRAADGGVPLLEQAELSFAPSLAFLTSQTQPKHGKRAKSARLLAFGAPALNPSAKRTGQKAALPAGPRLRDDELSPLPDAERQLRLLGKLYGPAEGQVFTGREAHEATFKRLAGEYDILHLATHGLYNDGAPLYSRLLLSQADLTTDEDGFLEAWELLGMKLHAGLAVLSACESGRGRVDTGEGVFGLTWALLMSGCREVVVSQWKVDSAGTSELMLGLHRRLRQGLAPARALREASLELRRTPAYRHPFYWAPFVAVGAAAEEG